MKEYVQTLCLITGRDIGVPLNPLEEMGGGRLMDVVAKLIEVRVL